jgi:hypothetical protein
MEERDEQDKQYELYLQEIVELRQKIKYLSPSKFEPEIQMDCLGRPINVKNKKTKIYFLMTQVKSRL